MADQSDQSKSGDQQAKKNEVLDALRKEGITDLDKLAEEVAKRTGTQAGQGATAMSIVGGPHYVVSS